MKAFNHSTVGLPCINAQESYSPATVPILNSKHHALRPDDAKFRSKDGFGLRLVWHILTYEAVMEQVQPQLDFPGVAGQKQVSITSSMQDMAMAS